MASPTNPKSPETLNPFAKIPFGVNRVSVTHTQITVQHDLTLPASAQAYDYNDLSVAVMGQNPSIQLGFTAPASNQALHMKSHIFLRFGESQLPCLKV